MNSKITNKHVFYEAMNALGGVARMYIDPSWDTKVTEFYDCTGTWLGTIRQKYDLPDEYQLNSSLELKEWESMNLNVKNINNRVKCLFTKNAITIWNNWDTSSAHQPTMTISEFFELVEAVTNHIKDENYEEE